MAEDTHGSASGALHHPMTPPTRTRSSDTPRKPAEAPSKPNFDFPEALSDTVFRHVTETILEGVWIVDADWRATYVNRGLTEMLGYDAADILGRPVEDFLFPEDLEDQRAQIVERRRGQARKYERRWRRRDGTAVWTVVSASPLLGSDGGVAGAVATLTDITRRREIEDTLRRERDLVSRMMDTSPVGIVATDRHGAIIFANTAAERVLGLTSDQVAGRPYNAPNWNITDLDGGPFPDEELPFQLVMSRGQAIFGVRHGIEHPGGERVFLSINAAPLFDTTGEIEGIVASLEDITDRVHAERDLRASEARLGAAIDAAPFGAHLYELLHDDRLVFMGANRSADLMLGVDHAMYVGKTIEEAFPPLVDTEIPAAYRRVAASGERYETDQVDYDEGSIRGAFQVSAFQTGPNRMAVFFRDITERTKAEQEKARLESQLAQAQKMESLGRLAGGIAHDFNNLLTAVMMHADVGLLQETAGASVHGALEGVKQAALSAADLTRRLLALSRRQVIQPQVLNLAEVIDRMSQTLRRVIGEDLELRIQCETDLGCVLADPSQVEQILLNLAVNARDAMPSGGTLEITAREVELDDAWCQKHLGSRPGRYSLLAVSDTGAGIPDDVLGKIFEPFVTTKPPGQGSGLGMAVVYGAVRQNNGLVEVRSEVGRGTTVEVYLPVCSDPKEEPAGQCPPVIVQGGTETVFLVEDEPLVRDIVAATLANLGYTVLPFATAEDALRTEAEAPDAIDLLLTDVVLPGMSGRELAAHLSARRPGLKVLYTSGHGEAVVARHGVLDPGLHFIEKPFQPDVLARKIREVLDSPAR